MKSKLNQSYYKFRVVAQAILFVLLSGFPVFANAWSVGDKVDIDKILDRSNELIDRTSNLKSRTIDTLTEVQNISNGFRASLGVISGQVSDGVRYGIEDIEQILDKNRAGLGDFLGVFLPDPIKQGIAPFDFTPPSNRATTECLNPSPCFQFRIDIKNILARTRDLSNAMLSVNGNDNVNMVINLDGFIDLIDWIPGRALYPLYRALNAGGADLIAGLPVLLDQAVVNFDTLSPIALNQILVEIPAATNENFPYLLYDAKDCQTIIDNYTLVVRAENGLAGTAQVLKILGKVFIAGGKTVMKNPKLAAGFTEFLGLQLELDGNFQDSVGNMLDGLSDALTARADSYDAMIDSCARLRAQLNTLDNQQIIIASLDNLQANPGSSPKGGAGAIAFNFFLILLLIASLIRQQQCKQNN